MKGKHKFKLHFARGRMKKESRMRKKQNMIMHALSNYLYGILASDRVIHNKALLVALNNIAFVTWSSTLE